MLRSLDNPTIEQFAYEAGLNASAGSISGTATKIIVDRFIAIYDHLAGSIFDRKVLKSLYPDTSNRTFTLQNLTFEQKRFKDKAEKLGYLNITGAQVPSPNGLIGSLLDYSNVLADYTEFGTRVEKSLTELYKQLAVIHNSDDMLRSASTVGKLMSIDTHDKYRAQLNAKLQKCIGPTAANTEVPYGNLVRNNKEMFQVFDHRNVFEKAVDEKTKNNIEDLISRISFLMDGFAARITDDSEEANGKVVSALSNSLYQCGQMVRDYGTYLFRINALIGVVDGVVVQVLKYTPEHVKTAVSEAVDDERRRAGNNDDSIQEEQLSETDITNLLIEMDKTDFNATAEQVERLTVVHDRVSKRGLISQADVDEVERAAPGLLSDVISRYTFTQGPSTAGLVPALNEMSGKAKGGLVAVAIAVIGAIIALIAKAISMGKKITAAIDKDKSTAAKAENANKIIATWSENKGKMTLTIKELHKEGEDGKLDKMKSAWQKVHGEDWNAVDWAVNPVMIQNHPSQNTNLVRSLAWMVMDDKDDIEQFFRHVNHGITQVSGNLGKRKETLASPTAMVEWYVQWKTDNRHATPAYDASGSSDFNNPADALNIKFIKIAPFSGKGGSDDKVGSDRWDVMNKPDYVFPKSINSNLEYVSEESKKVIVLAENAEKELEKLEATLKTQQDKMVLDDALTKKYGKEASNMLKEALTMFDKLLKADSARIKHCLSRNLAVSADAVKTKTYVSECNAFLAHADELVEAVNASNKEEKK